MKFEDIQKSWTGDCSIDDTELAKESVKIPQLHNKYLILYSNEKLRLKTMRYEYSKLVKLKKEYFQQDLLTDVIAFNLEEDGDPVEGEIYISLERVKENTRKFKQNVARELRRVIIHGCLHIMGYDDQTPEGKKTMTRMEDHYLS